MSLGTSRPHTASFTLVEKDGKYAFVLRGKACNWMAGYYGLPSGKIEVSEAASAAAIREAEEEISVTVKPENLRYLLTMHRHEEDDLYPEWVDFYFEADEWEGEPHNAEPHMHDQIAWFSLDELPENTIPSVRAALEAIQAGKQFTEYGY